MMEDVANREGRIVSANLRWHVFARGVTIIGDINGSIVFASLDSWRTNVGRNS